MKGYFNMVGIDIGGTKCAVTYGDSEGKIKEKIRFDTTTVNETLDSIFSAVEKMGKAKAIGISCGGPLDSKRSLQNMCRVFGNGNFNAD